MKNFLSFLSKNKSTINEEFVTSDDANKRVFYIGSTTNEYDMNAVNGDGTISNIDAFLGQQWYKNLNTLQIQNAAFVTVLPQYAIDYAIGYSNTSNRDNDDISKDDKSKDGLVVAIELPAGQRLFDLGNANDYKSLGLKPDIASIFAKGEPYFMLNSAKIPINARQYVPWQFKSVLKFFKKHLKSSTNYELIEKLKNSPVQPTQLFTIFENTYFSNSEVIKRIEHTFENIFGKTNWANLRANYSTRLIGDKNGKFSHDSFIDKIREDLTQCGREDKLNVNRFQNKDKNYTPGLFDANQYYVGEAIEKRVPASLLYGGTNNSATTSSNYILFQNYLRLFTPEKIDSITAYKNSRKPARKCKPWFEIMQLLYDTLKTNSGIIEFDNGLKSIIERMANIKDKHVYIDTLQFVFFWLLTHNKLLNGQPNPFIGIHTVERLGYKAMDNNSQFRRKNDINDVLIFTRPLNLSKENVFAHSVDFVKNIDVNSKKYKHIDEMLHSMKIHNIDEYKKAYYEMRQQPQKKAKKILYKKTYVLAEIDGVDFEFFYISNINVESSKIEEDIHKMIKKDIVSKIFLNNLTTYDSEDVYNTMSGYLIEAFQQSSSKLSKKMNQILSADISLAIDDKKLLRSRDVYKTGLWQQSKDVYSKMIDAIASKINVNSLYNFDFIKDILNNQIKISPAKDRQNQIFALIGCTDPVKIHIAKELKSSVFKLFIAYVNNKHFVPANVKRTPYENLELIAAKNGKVILAHDGGSEIKQILDEYNDLKTQPCAFYYNAPRMGLAGILIKTIDSVQLCDDSKHSITIEN